MRVLVIWVAMVGAMVASRSDDHIRIDLATRFVPVRWRRPLARFANGFTCAVFGVFAWFSLQFVLFEHADGMIAFGARSGLALRSHPALRRGGHVPALSIAHFGTTMIWAGLALTLVAALAGAPLVAVLMAAAMLGFLAADINLTVVAIEVYRIVDTPLLVALPLFTYAGYVLAEAKTSERLVALVRSLLGWLPCGLAIVGFIACGLFTALTGASGVTIVALGALLLPALLQAGYGERFSLGLVTTSGSLGLLLAPSLPLILYGVIAQQINVGEPFTIIDLFKAGVLPLLLMLACLVAWTLWTQRRGLAVPTSNPAGAAAEPARIWPALLAARWELPLPLGGAGRHLFRLLRHLRGGGGDRGLRYGRRDPAVSGCAP